MNKIATLSKWMRLSLTVTFCLIIGLRMSIWGMGGDPLAEGWLIIDIIVGITTIYIWTPYGYKRLKK